MLWSPAFTDLNKCRWAQEVKTEILPLVCKEIAAQGILASKLGKLKMLSALGRRAHTPEKFIQTQSSKTSLFQFEHLKCGYC